ncbi:tyrosine-type recombinase/integrase [Shewanella marisflavi]|uniref:Integrase n=1 Tax=Shewanella marisflavi TaxID=260364 RepID=A0AAC9U1N3_9GAMM|nr:site-specific integrase [Shewanella marisflavi]ASJ97684.1 integrase [Shewanella marisflavi]
MNSNLCIPFSNKLIKQFFCYTGHLLYSDSGKKTRQVEEFSTFLERFVSKSTISDFHNNLELWWQGHAKYLALNCSEVKGLSIRIYKAQLVLSKARLQPIDNSKLGVVYLRYRDALTAKLKTIKIGELSSNNISLLVKAAIQLKSGNCLGVKLLEKQKRVIPNNEAEVSLRTFLYSDYLETKRYENPKTVMCKINVIKRHFSPYLDNPITDITAEEVRQWMRSKELKLSYRQLAAGESLWSLKPSTLKEVICTLRACIQLAKEKGVIKDHDLYSLPKIKVDNQVILYLSDSEEVRLYNAINQRNTMKHEQRCRTIAHREKRRLPVPTQLTDCHFADHVTPFIILFKETGIRPGTLFNSRWLDVDLENRFIRIRKTLDKRGVANFIPLNDLAYSTLIEWRKHHIHSEALQSFKNRSESWLFPSPFNPSNQLTTIKKSWAKLLKNAGIEKFRLYDLRHDFASKLMMKTGNIYMVSQLLNHQQIETTKRYAHLMDTARFDAVGMLDLSRQLGALPDFLK